MHDAPESEETSKGTDGPDETATTDRVEISDEARAAHAKLRGEDSALVERGRQRLLNSGLTDERVAELRQRVNDGHYTTSDVTEQVAEGLLNDLRNVGEG